MARTRIALAIAASLLAACGTRRPATPATREPAPAPGAAGRTSDRGDRFVPVTPIGQLAPEEAPSVFPPPAAPSPSPPPPAQTPR